MEPLRVDPKSPEAPGAARGLEGTGQALADPERIGPPAPLQAAVESQLMSPFVLGDDQVLALEVGDELLQGVFTLVEQEIFREFPFL